MYLLVVMEVFLSVVLDMVVALCPDSLGVRLRGKASEWKRV
jgi:hypothetical protein